MEKMRVIIESAYPLTESQQESVAEGIKETLSLKGKANFYFALNPELKEGLKVHFGSVVLDDSVIGKWNAVRHLVEQENLTEISIKDIPNHLLKSLSG